MQKNVLEYFENTLQQYRDKTAVIDNERILTFDELGKLAIRLSLLITQTSPAINRPIAVFLPKSADSLIAFMGILYSGNIYTPVDVKSPPGRISSIIDNLEKPLIITAEEYLEQLLAIGAEREKIIFIDSAYTEASDGLGPAVNNYQQIIDTDPVYIMYTSGSTGIPKGVVVSHRGVIDYIDWALECFDITAGEILGSQAPFYFDNSTLDVYLCLAAGATLVIIPEQYFAFPVRLLEYLAAQNVNFIFWVPSVLINVANTRALDSVPVPSLRKILFAGEIMPNKHLNYWREKMPGVLYANLYGPTEITVDCTYYIVEKQFADTDKLPIGFPCRNTDVIILNEANQLAQVNEPGELCVRGSSLALGYWNNFDKSEEVFTQNPLNHNFYDRIYRTGDFCYRNEESEIIFMGRRDAQIKHLGYRIELGEIETALLSLEGIHNSCVLYNHEKQELIMFYEGDDEMNKAVIRKGLVPLLPKYMIPTRIYKRDKLPLNKNGKIDRQQLLRGLEQ